MKSMVQLGWAKHVTSLISNSEKDTLSAGACPLLQLPKMYTLQLYIYAVMLYVPSIQILPHYIMCFIGGTADYKRVIYSN